MEFSITGSTCEVLHISKCLHDEKLCFDSFLSLLMEKVNIQREIAIQNNKLTTFNEIYGNLINFSSYFILFYIIYRVYIL